MANRPKRKKKPSPKVTELNSPPDLEPLDLQEEEALPKTKKKKTYRNKPKKRKPFVKYISLSKYKPSGIDNYFGNNGR